MSEELEEFSVEEPGEYNGGGFDDIVMDDPEPETETEAEAEAEQPETEAETEEEETAPEPETVTDPLAEMRSAMQAQEARIAYLQGQIEARNKPAVEQVQTP